MSAGMDAGAAMTLERGLAIVAAAQGEARKRGMAGVAVVVMDLDGAIRVAVREDPQGAFGIAIATAKARTALGFLRSTLALSGMFTDPVAMTGLAEAVPGGVLAIGGGVVVHDPDGRRIGAAAVAGGLPATDHEVVCAAVAAAGLAVAG